ncbi:MAG: tripartite tricarboxylate transporter substrate binding protein [Proteobacteria bacterium]|nr:tripartite tricarboxylate transporter substrate binding protein [Pseudomonadota bacterium]
MKKRVIWAAAALAAATLSALPAQAQSAFPTRPITLVVPFTPGSTSDISARLVAQKIAGPLGQPVVVENRPGANGQLGMQAVARAAPDGHTLVVGSVSATIVPTVIQKSVPFDILKDFAPVSVIAGTTLVLLAAKEAPYNSVAELVAAAKKAPGTMSYANSAGLYRVSMEALNLQAGIDLAPIAYKGPAEAANDLIGGRLSVAPDSLGSATRLIQAGRTKALAVLSGRRSSALPEVPTMQELGYKDFDFNGWISILAPAGTPPAVLQRLHEEIAKAVAADDVRQQYLAVALDPVTMGPKEYRELLEREIAKYQRIGRDARIEKQ